MTGFFTKYDAVIAWLCCGAWCLSQLTEERPARWVLMVGVVAALTNSGLSWIRVPKPGAKA